MTERSILHHDDDVGIWTSFVRQVGARPEATALVWHDERISYRQLHDLACRAHATIVGLGPCDNEIVGIPATKSPSTIALVLACLRVGRPVMLPSPTLPPATQERLFARARCCHVVHAEEIIEATPAGAGAAADAMATDAVPASPGDVAFVLTTSGSTGLPKLVPLSGGGVERFVGWASEQFGIGPDTTVLNYAPLNFDLCFLDIWTTLLRGGRVVLVDPDTAAHGDHLLDLIADNDVNVVQAVPMCFRLLVDAADADADSEQPPQFGAVRHVMFTGDHMPPKLLARLPELFPRARLHNIYGCTETNDSFIHEVDTADMPQSALPLGTPLPGVETLIVDDDDVVVTGAGRGELLVATPFQTAGYLPPADGDDASNESTFVLRRHGTGVSRFYRTGDIVRRIADGQIHLEGRNDFQVKVRGTRVNTAEVEQALLEHDGILEAAVVAVPDPIAGHLLHSVVQRAPGVQLNSLVLRQHCAERIPAAAIPTTMRLVDDPLPKTSTGKVDRKVLADLTARKDISR